MHANGNVQWRMLFYLKIVSQICNFVSAVTELSYQNIFSPFNQNSTIDFRPVSPLSLILGVLMPNQILYQHGELNIEIWQYWSTRLHV